MSFHKFHAGRIAWNWMVGLNIQIHISVGVSLEHGLDHVDDRLSDVVVAVAVNDGIHCAVDKG